MWEKLLLDFFKVGQNAAGLSSCWTNELHSLLLFFFHSSIFSLIYRAYFQPLYIWNKGVFDWSIFLLSNFTFSDCNIYCFFKLEYLLTIQFGAFSGFPNLCNFFMITKENTIFIYWKVNSGFVDSRWDLVKSLLNEHSYVNSHLRIGFHERLR